MFALLLSFLSWGAPIDRIAAVVNSEVITLSEVYDLGTEFIIKEVLSVEERRAAEIKVLESLIQRKLIAQEMQNLGLDVTEAELDKSIGDVARANQFDVETLKKEVLKSGISWDQYRKEMKESLRQMKFNQAILQPRISVDEDALLDKYRRLSGNAPEEAELGAIFLSNPISPSQDVLSDKELLQRVQRLHEEALGETVSKIQSRLKSGEVFSDLAKEYDQGAFGIREGKMGTFAQGALRADLDQAAFSTPVSSLSDPVCDTSGCFLLYVFSKRRTATQSFEELRPSILESYYAERFEVEQKKWIEQVKRRASIDIKLAAPPSKP
ncbi:MAG: SurA N-terminal domain-containing protein [Myxococcota bacterium]|nr:SurA N-terminal domain-containing protein [Myxococcota bacterium]